MDVTLVRHATLVVDIEDTRFLVDPMLSASGANPPVENTPNQQRNPLVDLPDVPLDHDAVVVTHRHPDHWNDWQEAIDTETPLFCNPAEADAFTEEGFEDVRPVEDSQSFEDITIRRTPARHGHGELAEVMAPVCGFVLEGDETLYLAGDTVWYPPIPETIDTNEPDAVVVNAGAAQFLEGKPITMDETDVDRARQHIDTETPVLAVHMESINHCLLSRDELDEAVDDVIIPADGETVELNSI
ncbi:MBL fold metallo-hydrolase [Halococcus sp. IIIV-5B]|uniref:MBL fold metallo-hydrolase n=1 Tax=Halococcus sp. IIIV-5B TaxID=2321230 RepID=UPI000E74A454|nr:MBL fold metallo-hydrolase [Halococcus sp. IIIV-5B]RJT07961.1 MBL fold metallo-hydrolase [Halococcus sp. IIIV-5B]